MRRAPSPGRAVIGGVAVVVLVVAVVVAVLAGLLAGLLALVAGAVLFAGTALVIGALTSPPRAEPARPARRPRS